MRRRNAQSSEEDRESQSPRRDRSRQRPPQNDEGDESNGDHNEMYTEQNQQSSNNRDPRNIASKIACEMRSKFLQFWGSVKHEKGFVFTKQQRQALINQQKKILKKNKEYKYIEWKPQCEWDQEEENRKIRKMFDYEQLKIPQSTRALLQDVFLQTSYVFGSETTEQLYRLLMGIVKIQMNDGENQDKKVITDHYMEMLMKGSDFKFFNYQFSKKFKLSNNTEDNLIIYQNLGLQLALIMRPYIKLQ